MNDITRAIARPTPVTLGGREFLASELRLGDLADLQAYVARRIPSPYRVARPFLSRNPGGPGWKRLLAETYDRQESWPPPVSSPEGIAAITDARGLPYFAWVVLRREHPMLSPDIVAESLADATTEELADLGDVAWAIDPMGPLTSMVDGPASVETHDGRPMDWVRAKYLYMTKCRTGPPFEELTLTDFRAFRAEGELESPGMFSGDLADFGPELIARQERRDAFWEEIQAEAEGAPDGGYEDGVQDDGRDIHADDHRQESAG